jgi:hypothetical protein
MHMLGNFVQQYHVFFDTLFDWLAKLTGGYHQAAVWKDSTMFVCAFISGCLVTFFLMNAVLLRVYRSNSLEKSSIMIVEAKGKKWIIVNPKNIFDLIDAWVAIFKVLVLRINVHITPRNRTLSRIAFFVIVSLLSTSTVVGFLFASHTVTETEYNNYLTHKKRSLHTSITNAQATKAKDSVQSQVPKSVNKQLGQKVPELGSSAHAKGTPNNMTHQEPNAHKDALQQHDNLTSHLKGSAVNSMAPEIHKAESQRLSQDLLSKLGVEGELGGVSVSVDAFFNTLNTLPQGVKSTISNDTSTIVNLPKELKKSAPTLYSGNALNLNSPLNNATNIVGNLTN